MMQSPSQGVASPWLTFAEAACRLRMSESSLKRLMRAGRIKYSKPTDSRGRSTKHRPGRFRVYFHIDQLDAYLNGNIDLEAEARHHDRIIEKMKEKMRQYEAQLQR